MDEEDSLQYSQTDGTVGSPFFPSSTFWTPSPWGSARPSEAKVKRRANWMADFILLCDMNCLPVPVGCLYMHRVALDL